MKLTVKLPGNYGTNSQLPRYNDVQIQLSRYYKLARYYGVHSMVLIVKLPGNYGTNSQLPRYNDVQIQLSRYYSVNSQLPRYYDVKSVAKVQRFSYNGTNSQLQLQLHMWSDVNIQLHWYLGVNSQLPRYHDISSQGPRHKDSVTMVSAMMPWCQLAVNHCVGI